MSSGSRRDTRALHRSPHPSLASAGGALRAIHDTQVHRDPWPDFASFDVSVHPPAQRRVAAREWARRARLEHGSIHQFAQVSHALCDARAPLELLGALARLITDEVRHAELEWEMALACYPEGGEEQNFFAWPMPRTPWGPPPAIGPEDDVEPILAWAADAIVGACCIGETVSVPSLEALATVTTDPICEAVLRQILKDEHLHATFGFEALAVLWDMLGEASRGWLHDQLAIHFAAFELGVARGIALEDLVGRELVVEPGDPAEPNLGLMPQRHYALIYYATVEREIFPRLEAIGLDPRGAWAKRPGPPRG